MSKRQGVTIIFILSLLLVTLLTASFILFSDATAPSISSAVVTPMVKSTATLWTDPLATAHLEFTPVKLIIPKIRLDANVIAVGPDATGLMSTPKCISATDPVCGEVYWWSVGAVPGQRGNAVIAGHLNRPDNSPASFGSLSQLVTGDTFLVEVQNGATLSFTVTSTETVSAYTTGANDPIITDIFGPATTVNVNLITCAGDWDGHTFDHRLVVHAQLNGTSPFPLH
jgi:hypothetical protein